MPCGVTYCFQWQKYGYFLKTAKCFLSFFGYFLKKRSFLHKNSKLCNFKNQIVISTLQFGGIFSPLGSYAQGRE